MAPPQYSQRPLASGVVVAPHSGQVCATLGAVGALPEARRLAAVKTNPVLRASSIAAVGFLGDRSDLAWLTPLATSSDTRLRIPARAAIRRLQEKP